MTVVKCAQHAALAMMLATGTMLSGMQPAHGIFIVEDIETEFETLNTYLQSVKIWIQEQLSWVTQLQQLQQDISMASSDLLLVYNFIGNPSLGTLMGVLNLVGLTQDLPISPYSVMNLIEGSHNISNINSIPGMLSGLSSMIPVSYSNNTIYSCSDNSVTCSMAQMRASGLAGQKSQLGMLFQDFQTHISALTAARTDLNAATDTKTAVAATGQVTIENAYVTDLAGQAAIVAALGQAQAEQRKQQGIETLQSDYDAFHQAVPP